MVWSTTRGQFGVCGNFRFEMWDLTDVKATQSIIKPMMSQVHFVATTNTTDNADVLAGQTLNWTGTAQVDVVNKIDMNATETFDPALTGLQVSNTTDNLTSKVEYSLADTDHLWGIANDAAGTVQSAGEGAVNAALFDICPNGNEAWRIVNERMVEVIAVDANDDGTMLLIGR